MFSLLFPTSALATTAIRISVTGGVNTRGAGVSSGTLIDATDSTNFSQVKVR